MKHVHAELMMEYAKDAMETNEPWKMWEYFDHMDKDWFALKSNPQFHPSVKYRRKVTQEVLPPVGTPVWVSGNYSENWVIAMFLSKDVTADLPYLVTSSMKSGYDANYRYITTKNPYLSES